MAINVTLAPAVEPVTLTEAKLHCRVDATADEALITSLITVARQYCENFTGRAFVTQTIEYTLDRWPSGRMIYLPRPPVQSISSVVYYDKDNTLNTLTLTNDYLVDVSSQFARVVLPRNILWPTEILHPVNPIRVTYVAGYGLAAAVPEYIKAAIKLCVGNWYENREAVLPAGHIGKELPMGAQALLWQERMFFTEELNK
jgi:uncharacterized phiE125 gp8 family phage protein